MHVETTPVLGKNVLKDSVVGLGRILSVFFTLNGELPELVRSLDVFVFIVRALINEGWS